MDINDYFDNKLIKELRDEIKKASGNEVYFVAKIDIEEKKVCSFEVRARGNRRMVPALLADLNPGQLIIHNHPSGNLDPSAPDIRLASKMGEKGIGFAIINNEVNDIYVVVEPKKPEKKVSLNYEKLHGYFDKKGEIATHLENYEYREEQMKVLKKVVDSFNNYNFSLIEAGTGTGKSLAYLIPALYWAHQNNETVVVSTNTINLQEQLIKKDLVLLKKVLPFDFKEILVKGRNNYVCRRKLNKFKKSAADYITDRSEEKQFKKIVNWLKETERGTKSEAGFVIDQNFWQEIASETDLCLNTKCPFFDSCFFMEARKEVYNADLLVVNHHLLLSDARLKKDMDSVERGVLPEYHHLIIDEAHNFERAATYHLGKPFNYNSLNKFFDHLHDHSYSVIDSLRNELGKADFKYKERFYKMIDNKIIPLLKKVKEIGSEYRAILADFFNDFENEYQIRLTAEKLNKNKWQKVYQIGDELIGYLKNLNYNLNSIYEDLLLLNEETKELLTESILDLEAAIGRAQILIDRLSFNLQAEKQNYVFWLENRGRKNILVSQQNAPLNISDLLFDSLWQKMHNLILTSATLTVNNSFNYIKENLGLPNSEQLKVESPFDYNSQAMVVIPDDIPSPGEKNFSKVISENLSLILNSYGGKTMVLFTSYKMLNYCLRQVEKDLNNNKVKILPQGRFPRHQIIKEFKEKENRVIFGTVSFWEGVDIRGDDLKYLFMMKLPFPVPSEPIAAARSEKLEKEGKNPFFNYSLPRAVIRFKQGFGRLIRSRSDKGMVVIFDNRIAKKSYGNVFLNSLPSECPVKTVRVESLIYTKSKE